MQIRDIEKLKVWLLKKLQPVCDADPAALSKYIVALLRKEKPRSALKELCINQLEVFLSKETPNFVDKLFRSLDNESYLTGGDELDATPPMSVVGSNRSSIESGRSMVSGKSGSPSVGTVPERIVTDHRRQSEDIRHREVDDDERDFRRAHYRHDSDYYSHVSNMSSTDKNRIIKKKIEIEPPRRSIRQRLGNREDERRRRRVRSRSRSSTPDRTSSPSPSTTPTGDLDERGRRKRTEPMGGVSNDMKPMAKKQRCKDYDEKGMCLLGEQCPYDHGSDPLVITGIPPYPPPPFPLAMAPPPTIASLSKASSGTTDGYNPEEPSLTTSGSSHTSLPPPPLLPHQLPMRPAFSASIPGLPGLHPPLHAPMPNPPISSGAFAPVNNKTTPMSRPGMGMAGSKIPSRPSDTIVLRKIPRDMNTITKLSGYFEKFGTIVNLQVRYENDPESAIVQFSTPAEAKSAHDCTEAVLNNRFIRVYYLKNTGGMVDGKTQPTSQINKTNITIPSCAHQPSTIPVNTPPTTSSAEIKSLQTTPTTMNSKPRPPHHSSHQHKLHKSSGVTAAAASLKRLELQKKTQVLLESQIKQQKLLLNKLEKSGKSLSIEERDKIMETLKSLSANINKLKDSLSSVNKIKSSAPAAATNKSHNPSISTTPTASLQQQANQLRNEAQKLGILPSSGDVPNNTPLPASHAHSRKKDQSDLRKKIDAKPRQLIVINVEDKEALVKYFESFGGLTQIERDPENSKNLIFTFKSRNIAEKAVKGSLFQGKPLIMKWYSPKPHLTSPAAPTTPTTITPTTTVSPPTNDVVTKSHVTSNEGHQLENQTEKKKKSPPSSLTLLEELQELEAELQDSDDNISLPVDVYTPEQSKPRAVHLLDDDEEEDERSWRH